MLTWQSMVDKKQYLTMFYVSKINFKVKVIERTSTEVFKTRRQTTYTNFNMSLMQALC